MQTKRMSAFEALCNTASGFVLSWLVGLVVFPLLGWDISVADNTAAVAIFTVTSIIRSYIWRRVFNNVNRNFLSR